MKNKGATFIEILISIAVVGGAIAVFGSLISLVKLNATTALYSSAYRIAEEELEALRSVSATSLAERSNGAFLYVLHNYGKASAAPLSTSPSLPNSLRLTTTSSISAILNLPQNKLTDFTIEANVYASSSVDKTGLMFRARDVENNYKAYIQNNKIVLEKIVNNSAVNLYENLQPFNPNTWYKLKIVATGPSISLYLNDQLTYTANDSDIADGSVAIFSEANESYFDDVLLDSSLWNFDSEIEGALPDDLKKFGLYNLPQGAGTLTIASQYGDPSIKKIDVIISWVERGENRSITLSTLKKD